MTYSTSTLGDSVAEFLSSLVIEATQSAYRSDSNTNQPAEGIPLFARHDKRSARQLLPLSTEAIERIFRELADMAGLSGAAITPDAVRQLAPISGYAATRQLEQIQQALHHAIPGQGSLYTRAAE